MADYKIKKIAGISGIKTFLKKKDETKGLALETPGSNLQKALDFIQRISYGEKQGLIDPEGFKTGFMKGLRGEAKPSGSEFIRALRGGKVPATKTGKAAETAGGFAVDVFNLLAPENWIGGGLVTKGGSALMKAGKLAGFAKGLQKGERSLIGARVPFTNATVPLVPGFVSKAAGHVFEGVGKGFKALPGAKGLIKTFAKPANKLAQFTGRIKSRAAGLSQEEAKRVGADAFTQIIARGAREIENGALAKINPKVHAHYVKEGYTPLEMASKEIARLVESPTINAIREAQGGLKLPKPGAGRKYENMAREALKNVPTKGDSLEILKKGAKIVESTGEKFGGLKANLGIASSLQGRMPRQLSKEAQAQMEFVGEGATGTSGNRERVIKELTTEEAEYLHKHSPELSAKYFGAIVGSKPLEKKAALLDSFRTANPKAASIYETNAAKLYGDDLVKSSRSIATAEAVHDFIKNPSFSRPTREAWGEFSGRVVPISIPNQFFKAFNNKEGREFVQGGKIWVDETIAHETQNMMGVLSNADKANEFFAYSDSVWKGITQAWKRWTLYSLPGSIFTIMRNFQGNMFLSFVRGAISANGVKGAMRSIPVFMRAMKDPRKFEELAMKMGPEGRELLAAKQGNLFEETQVQELFEGRGSLGAGIETAVGITHGGKANGLVENVGRFQHYLTRRKQGWSVEAAISDTRDSLYDYVNGLPPVLQRFKNSPVGMPFVTWIYNNIPAMMTQALKHPGRMIVPDRVKRNIEGIYGVDAEGGKPDERALGEYIKGDENIRLYQDPETGKWTYIRLKGGVPVADLEDITSISKFVDMAVSSLNPLTKTPIELLTNKSLFFKTAGGERAPLESYPGEKGEFLGMQMPRKTIAVLRNARILGEINKYLPSKEGAPRLSPTAIGIRQLGLSAVPVDLQRDTQRAKSVFRKRLSDLKLAKRWAEYGNRSTGDIEKKIKELVSSGYRP